MSILDTLEVPGDIPLIATICGEAGSGKTSLASTFPNPVFIQVEKGMQAIPEAERPQATPLINSSEELYEYLGALITDEHDFKTCVIDSITQLDVLFQREILEETDKPNMNEACGGYGKAWGRLAAMHDTVRQWTETLRSERKMHVVFIAHTIIENMAMPDLDDYTRYGVNLVKNKQGDCQKPYVDNVDIVAFVKLKTRLLSKENSNRQKAISDGSRIVECSANPANVSKNRFGIDKPLPFIKGENPFVEFVASLSV